jgi:hypothetical protein
LKFGDFITAIFHNTLNDKIVKGPFEIWCNFGIFEDAPDTDDDTWKERYKTWEEKNQAWQEVRESQ